MTFGEFAEHVLGIDPMRADQLDQLVALVREGGKKMQPSDYSMSARTDTIIDVKTERFHEWARRQEAIDRTGLPKEVTDREPMLFIDLEGEGLTAVLISEIKLGEPIVRDGWTITPQPAINGECNVVVEHESGACGSFVLSDGGYAFSVQMERSGVLIPEDQPWADEEEMRQERRQRERNDQRKRSQQAFSRPGRRLKNARNTGRR